MYCWQKEVNMKIGEDTGTQIYLSSEVKFYTVDELKELLGWSRDTVLKLFNDPKFPSSDFGREKVVEVHALIDYFSTKHIKRNDRFWNKEC